MAECTAAPLAAAQDGDDAPESSEGTGAKKKKKGKKKHKDDGESAKKGSADEAKASDPSSEGVRGRKHFGADLVYTPLSDFFLQYGVRGYFQKSAALQLGVVYLGGKADLKSKLGSDGVTVDKAAVAGLAVLGYARYFIGNSFSATGGLGYRRATGDLALSNPVGDHISAAFTATSIVVPLAVGNHWTFGSGLTIGCDWLAGMIPLSHASSATTSSNIESQQQSEVTNTFKDLGDSVAKISSLTFFLTSVGFLF